MVVSVILRASLLLGIASAAPSGFINPSLLSIKSIDKIPHTTSFSRQLHPTYPLPMIVTYWIPKKGGTAPDGRTLFPRHTFGLDGVVDGDFGYHGNLQIPRVEIPRDSGSPPNDVQRIGNAEEPSRRVRRQVIGSPVFAMQTIDFLSKECAPAGVIGSTVAGASGGPVGLALGLIGGAIASCNWNA